MQAARPARSSDMRILRPRLPNAVCSAISAPADTDVHPADSVPSSGAQARDLALVIRRVLRSARVAGCCVMDPWAQYSERSSKQADPRNVGSGSANAQLHRNAHGRICAAFWATDVGLQGGAWVAAAML